VEPDQQIAFSQPAGAGVADRADQITVAERFRRPGLDPAGPEHGLERSWSEFGISAISAVQGLAPALVRVVRPVAPLQLVEEEGNEAPVVSALPGSEIGVAAMLPRLGVVMMLAETG
jgi:hypothetical protein